MFLGEVALRFRSDRDTCTVKSRCQGYRQVEREFEMSVNVAEVVELYTKGQPDHACRSPSRVGGHQGPRSPDSERGWGGDGASLSVGAPRRRTRAARRYRAYQMTAETRVLIDRLAETLGVSRTAVVTRAVEELAERAPPSVRQVAESESQSPKAAVQKGQAKGRRGRKGKTRHSD